MPEKPKKRQVGRPRKEVPDIIKKAGVLKRRTILLPESLDEAIKEEWKKRGATSFTDTCIEVFDEHFGMKGTPIVGYAYAGVPSEAEVDGGTIICNMMPGGDG